MFKSVSEKIETKLLEFTAKNDFKKIKTFLEKFDAGKKDEIFAWYLAELFQGNGWLINIKDNKESGIDILLSQPNNPNKVVLVVRVKNTDKKLNFEEVRNELNIFEKNEESYHCNQFNLISLNGFDKKSYELDQFNMLFSDWSYVESLIERYNSAEASAPEIELYAHNKRAYDNIYKLWKETNEVAVVHATGTGKSYIIAKVMSDFFNAKKLVLAPSILILDQQSNIVPWAKNSTIFMTYSKAANLTDDEINQLNPELIILDEFHRAGAEEWGKGVEKICKHYPNAKKLGVTATKTRYLDGMRDMSSELFNGVVASEIPLVEAVVNKILPAPKYICALYELDEEVVKIKEKLKQSQMEKGDKKNLSLELDQACLDWKKTKGMPNLFKKHLTSKLQKIIVFCKDKKHLNKMQPEVEKWFEQAGIYKNIKSFKVYCGKSENKKVFDEFRNTKEEDTFNLLFTINMLNEGLHAGDVGAVVLLRPTESPIIFYQQIGRCMEVDAEHQPIIFDVVNNFNNIRANDFKKDLDVAQKNREEIRKKLGLKKDDVSVCIYDETREIVDLLSGISNRLEPWEVGYRHLLDYVEEFKTAKVPARYVASDAFNLGYWVNTRRQDKKAGRLLKERIVLLEKLPNWVWENDAFEKGYNYLQSYVEKFGTSRVAQGTVFDDFNLGDWVTDRRKDKKAGRLSNERIVLLEKLPNWVWENDAFEKGYNYLQSYVEKFGTSRVLWNAIVDGFNLGRWVHDRRRDKKTGRLPKERIVLLEKLPDWVWIVDYFTEGYQHLKSYVLEFKTSTITRSYVTKDGFNLGIWVYDRRYDKKKNRLSEEKVKLLEDLPEWKWDDNIFEKNFTKGYGHLKDYVLEFGTSVVLSNYVAPDGFKLGSWVSSRRRDKKGGVLTEDRIKLLEELPGWVWEVRKK